MGVGGAYSGGRFLCPTSVRRNVGRCAREEVAGDADPLHHGAAEDGHGVEHAVGGGTERSGDPLGGQDQDQCQSEDHQGDREGPGPHEAQQDPQSGDEAEGLRQDGGHEGLRLGSVIRDPGEQRASRFGADGG